jgi:hypothetical protein
MRGPCWGSTAIFVSWDDWGGLYDHVSPPVIDEQGYGLRVPGLVISPYAKTGFIDHQQLSHDAYLKFIEDDFLSGARLDPSTDGRPDPRPDVREEASGLGDLANEFDFSQPALPPLILPTHPEPGPASEPPGGNPPVVETGLASSVTQTMATLNATVNPTNRTVSDCHFEYGTSSFYEASIPCVPSPGSGSNPVAVYAQLQGLVADTTYHFRIVATNGGTSSGDDQLFRTLPNPPAITATKPGTGPVGGGTSVQISGVNFTSVKSVKFGQDEAPSFTVSSSTLISAVSPRGSAGKVDITVVNAGGTSTLSSADQFRFLPTVSNVSPNEGSTAGGTTITIAGGGFALGTTATSFNFGSAKAATVNCTSTTTCTVLAPAHEPGTVDVKATVNKASSAKNALTDQFTYK